MIYAGEFKPSTGIVSVYHPKMPHTFETCSRNQLTVLQKHGYREVVEELKDVTWNTKEQE